MELCTLTSWMALISSLLLTLTTTPVHSRAVCKGRWRIHTCLGGNGKRSDPRMMAGSNLPTLAARLREARRLTLQSAVRTGYQSERSPPSLSQSQSQSQASFLLSSLKPQSDFSFSDNLLAKELAAYLQQAEDDVIPGDKDYQQTSLQAAETPEEATNFRANDDVIGGGEVVEDDEGMTPVDLETVRDIFTALTLQRVLRKQAANEASSDISDRIL